MERHKAIDPHPLSLREQKKSISLAKDALCADGEGLLARIALKLYLKGGVKTA